MVELAVLSIAGLDPSGGAGVLADARTIASLGCKPMAVITATTEQSSEGLWAAEPIAPDFVRAQIARLRGDTEIAAVKLGMMVSEAHARAVATALAGLDVPIVWDPCIRPTRGGVDLYQGDVAALLSLIGPVTTLCTPNLPEASVLRGAEVCSRDGMEEVGVWLVDECDVGAVLVKGGHLEEGEEMGDLLVTSAGAAWLAGERVEHVGTVHGTGCLLSAAIATLLAQGFALKSACQRAAGLVRDRLADPVVYPGGSRAVF
jgi:hydroxymethylpyrimidine/phosphomethylpyrimidine kinase